MEELQAKLDSGEINSEENKISVLIQQEFPDIIVEGLRLNNFKKLAFTLAHNQFYTINKNNKYFELSALVLNKEGEIIG